MMFNPVVARWDDYRNAPRNRARKIIREANRAYIRAALRQRFKPMPAPLVIEQRPSLASRIWRIIRRAGR